MSHDVWNENPDDYEIWEKALMAVGDNEKGNWIDKAYMVRPPKGVIPGVNTIYGYPVFAEALYIVPQLRHLDFWRPNHI